MNPEQLTGFVQSVAALIQALGWPLLVLFIILYFGKALRDFLSHVGEFTFKAGAAGLEATAKRQQIEAAAALGVASGNKIGAPATSNATGDEQKALDIANVVSRAASPRAMSRLSDATVLWVDDRPANNQYERKALQAFGIHFDLSTDTADAVEKLKRKQYDAIISDMGRPPDAQAGYTLLDEVKKLGIRAPYIIYAGSSAAAHQAETVRRGGFGTTNNPQELFGMVIQAIQSTNKS